MKVVVGTNTIVKKVTVGTPLRVGSAANGSLTGLDDVNGSINLADGTLFNTIARVESSITCQRQQ